MKKALVLAGGIPQIKLIQELQQRGYFVILADYSKQPPAAKYADRFICESTLNVEAIRKIALTEKVDLITTCCTDQALATVSLLSEELGLPCYISADLGLEVTNKKYMKDKFFEYKIPTARYVIVDNCDVKIDMEYPLVVKPVDCNSSKGVIRVNNIEELREAVNNALALSRTKTAIVEKYIEGQEVSVDAFIKDGKVVVLCKSRTDKAKGEEGFIIKRGWYPASISPKVDEDINIIAQRIADAFQLKNGPMLIQLLVSEDAAFVIEFSARTGGCIKYKMIELASGFDVIKSMVDMVEGIEVDLCIDKSQKYIINEFLYASQGIFSHVTGIDECKKNGWIREAYVLKSPGTEIGKTTNSGDRVIALTYVVDTKEEYLQLQRKISENIKILDSNGKDILRRELMID